MCLTAHEHCKHAIEIPLKPWRKNGIYIIEKENFFYLLNNVDNNNNNINNCPNTAKLRGEKNAK